MANQELKKKKKAKNKRMKRNRQIALLILRLSVLTAVFLTFILLFLYQNRSKEVGFIVQKQYCEKVEEIRWARSGLIWKMYFSDGSTAHMKPDFQYRDTNDILASDDFSILVHKELILTIDSDKAHYSFSSPQLIGIEYSGRVLLDPQEVVGFRNRNKYGLCIMWTAFYLFFIPFVLMSYQPIFDYMLRKQINRMVKKGRSRQKEQKNIE